MKFKKEMRILGIDDSPFKNKKRENVLVIGAFFRGGQRLEGILATKIAKDGNNSTKKLIKMIENSKFYSQIRAIMLDGIALGGFNVVDINKLSKHVKIPVIVVMRDYPNLEKIYYALKKIRKQGKIKLIAKAGTIYKAEKIYIQISGIKIEDAKKVVKICTTHSHIPEPLRIAHIIASGIKTGESYGRA